MAQRRPEASQIAWQIVSESARRAGRSVVQRAPCSGSDHRGAGARFLRGAITPLTANELTFCRLVVSGPFATLATCPTSTPRSLTFAPGSITRPVRSDRRVTGTYRVNAPVNRAEHTTTIVAITVNIPRAHHAGWTLVRFALLTG